MKLFKLFQFIQRVLPYESSEGQRMSRASAFIPFRPLPETDSSEIDDFCRARSIVEKFLLMQPDHVQKNSSSRQEQKENMLLVCVCNKTINFRPKFMLLCKSAVDD